ncbi:glycosyltransferase family A protein, partial [uncultured Flavobacterium sp.]|uniref:glycosyltransferase family A protein n=1 Tax=uncultured Flavobacterium sp. TaxID=165435 RepID=UPI0025FFE9DE
MADEFKKSDLEILVATMDRSNLDFLIPMFPFAHFSEFSILVVNQTTAENLIISDYENVRVINSYEKGLSKSRNLALKNTEAKVALIADDDVVFLPGFDSKILEAHRRNKDYSIICFQTLTNKNLPYISYRKEQFWMKEKDFRDVLSIELTFKHEDLQKKNIIFNEYFGLGAKFQDAESLFFLRRANYNQLKVLFCPENIVIHEAFSSSDDVAS